MLFCFFFFFFPDACIRILLKDGERCGKTIVDLFANAKDPDKIVVGIIDQSYEEDLLCLESYCKEMGKFFSWVVMVMVIAGSVCLSAMPLSVIVAYKPSPRCLIGGRIILYAGRC